MKTFLAAVLLAASPAALADRDYSSFSVSEIHCSPKAKDVEKNLVTEVTFRPNDLFVIKTRSGKSVHMQQRHFIKGQTISIYGTSSDSELSAVQVLVRDRHPSTVIVRRSHVEYLDCTISGMGY